MKRIFAWVLLLVMVLGVFAGCKKTETVEPTGGDYISAEAAMEYLKALYKTPDEALKTPRDYERYGVIRVGGEPFTVVWTVEGADELVKVVTDDSEIVVIDVDETCQEDTPYTLTATITDQGGNTVSYTWNCILPKALDVEKVLKEAYALADGETLPYEVTLTGKVTEIVKMYDAEYKNITVTMVVEGFEEYPIECYRLKGEGVETLQIGNIITVTGTIKNYKGKIEFDQGCILDKVEKGDAVDAPTDPLEIVAAAYALKDGQSLPYVATLTGKVIDIESPYDPDYGNITVAIEVEGAKGKPIVCYRLKGTGVDQVAIDDTITVKGIIKNYKGKIEFDSGCMMIDRVSGGRVAEKPSSDPKKIMADAAKLGWGQHLNYYATLTGKVIDVESPYDQAYKNITVVISVEGYGHMPITCYRLKGNGVEKIARGDIITVKGIIENYKGKLEFGSGCTLLDRLSGGGVAKPETAHTATIMTDAAKLQDGQHLDYYSSLTGVVTEIESPYDKAYGNITVIMTVAGYEGRPITCYRLKSGAYDVSKIAVGDTITVRGVLENYKGKLEYGSGCTLSYRKSGGGVAKPESSNAASILADALALEDGQKLDYYANLTGKVTEIDSPYDKNYGNISVIMEVENPVAATRSEGGNVISMLCYRLKSGAYDASKIAVGDTITVRGVIENYKGEIQFGSGSTLSKRVSGGGVAKPESSDEAAIMADALALAEGGKLDYYANLTGEVTTIKTWFDPNYGNVSLNIKLSDGTVLYCYRMKSGKADASEVRVGDTITVRGVIENYKGEVQMGAGCTVEKLVKGQNPGDSMTTQEILDAAFALASGESLEGAYELTGVITSVDTPFSSQYGNITVTMDVEGKAIQCFRLGTGSADVSNLKVGDTITVYGSIINYNGKVQFNQGCVLLACVPGEGGGSDVEIPDGSVKIEFTDTANRTAVNDDQQVWEQNGITVTNDKAASATAINPKYFNPIRLYQNSNLTIEYPGMTRLIFSCGAPANNKDYANGLIQVLKSMDNVVVTVNELIVVADLKEATDKLVIENLMYQTRLHDITVCTGTTPPEGGETPDTPDTPDTPVEGVATVVIYNPSSGKALSSQPCQAGSFYLGGVDVTADGSTLTGFGATEQWVLLDNGDGTYSFNYGGKNLAMGATYGSTPLGEVNDKWTVTDAGDGLYYIENVVRAGFRLEWFADKNNFSTYNYSNDGDLFKFAFYVIDGTLPEFGQGGNTNPDQPSQPSGSASLNFKDLANRVSHSVEQQVWQQNGITMTNDKADSTTDNFDGSTNNTPHVRWYTGANVTVEYPGMTRITFDVAFADRVDALADSLRAVDGATVTVNDLQITVDFAETDSFVFTLVSQTRVTGLTVYTGTTPPAGGDTPGGDDTEDETTGNVPVDDPVVGDAYKWAIDQKGKGVTLYFNGEMAATYYGGTTENIEKAVDVALESADNGYYLTFKDASGAKKYITITVKVEGDKTHRNLTISDTADNVYTYNEEYKTLTTVLSNGDECYFGTYGTYTTFSVSTIDKISTSYPAYFCIPGEGGETPDVPVTPPAGGDVTLQNGDQVVIYAPAYNKALSTQKTGNYNVGVDITVADGVVSGYGASEIFTVIANADGSYSFANGGKNLSINTGYSSLGLGGADDDWKLTSLGNGLYNVQNVTRSNYLEWYDQYSNWSTYGANNAATDKQFQLSFYVVGKGVAGDGGNQGGTTTPDVPVTPPAGGDVTLQNGDQVVIYAPAYNKALSTQKTGNYNVGVDITVADGVVSGYGASETFTVIANADGSYSFANGGKNLSINTGYSSLGLGGADDDWKLTSLGNGLYNVQNVTRSNYLEWYDQYSNWSTYGANNAATDKQFQLSFYVVGKGVAGDGGNQGGNEGGNDSGNQGGTTTPDNPVVPDAPSGAGTFKKVTSLAEIMAGGEFIIGAYSNGKYYFMGDALTVNRVDHVTGIAVANDQISGTDLPVWVVAKQGNGISLFSGSYLKYSGSSTALAVDTAAYEWTIAEKDNTDTFSLVASTDSSRWLAHRLSYNRFAGYKESSNNADSDYCFYLVFFKKAA